GLADLSEAAWRKRLRACNAWLLWRLSELIAAPDGAAPPLPGAPGRIVLVDASTLGQPGGTGDDWRLHLAYDFTAGRLGQVRVTDRYGGERLAPFALRPGDIAVADNGYGYRASVAAVAAQRADVVLRITPATFPLETAAEQPFDVLAWLRAAGGSAREWHGWGRGGRPGQCGGVVGTRAAPPRGGAGGAGGSGSAMACGCSPRGCHPPRRKRRGAGSAAKPRKRGGHPARPR